MRKPGLRTTTGLLLSAAMLLGSIVPPGQRHAHAGGDVAHDHHEQHAHDHSWEGHDCHHHLRHNATDQRGSITEAVEPAAVVHVHLACWLFDLTLPVRDESDSEDDESVYVVRLIDDCLPTKTSGPDTHSTAPSSRLPGIAVAPTTPTRRTTTSPHTAVLLSDAARHERSGVQLF